MTADNFHNWRIIWQSGKEEEECLLRCLLPFLPISETKKVILRLSFFLHQKLQLWVHWYSLLLLKYFLNAVNIFPTMFQLEKTATQTSSHLLLSAVQVADSGNYTCAPVTAPRTSVTVHVHSGGWLRREGWRGMRCSVDI